MKYLIITLAVALQSCTPNERVFSILETQWMSEDPNCEDPGAEEVYQGQFVLRDNGNRITIVNREDDGEWVTFYRIERGRYEETETAAQYWLLADQHTARFTPVDDKEMPDFYLKRR